MNPEIENCLSALRDRPQDQAILRTLEDHIRSEGQREDVVDALSRSLEHHQRLGEWEAAVGLIDLQLQVGEEGRKLELLSLKGRILEEELLEEEAAMQTFQQVLELEPEHEQTRETIQHIQLIRDNWEKVANKYIEEAEAVADSDRQLSTSLFLSAAEVIWRNQPDDERVERFLRRSLEVEPRNAKASSHLERLLRRRGQLEDLGELYEQRADVASTREERVAAFLAAGDLWAHELDNLEEAASRYKRALSLDPANPKALRYLVQTLTAQENWTALVRFYEEALRGRPQGPQELQILLQMGRLYNEKLEQPEQAEEYYRRVRRSEPTNREMLDFYRDYFRGKGEMAKLLPLLDTAQRGEEDAEKRIDLAREMARVAEEDVGNLEKAIDIWKGIQRMAPSTKEPTGALKRLYRQTQPPKWNALRELIKEEIEALGDDEESVDQKIELLSEIVEIYRDHLTLDVMVINTYNAILALKPDHAEALQALTEKYESLGRWNDLIALLMRRKDVETDPQAKVRTLQRVAALWIDRFGNQTQAITPLQEILSIDPKDSEALGRLKEIYLKRRNWRELMELLRLEVQQVEGARRRELYTEMARLAAEKLGEPREGIQVWNQVLAEEDPADPEALAELATLYRREGRWMALAEVLHRRVETVREDRELVAELLQTLGDIYTNRVRAVENAVGVWQELLRLDPDNAKARTLLRELLVQEKRWSDLDELFADRGEFAELAETLSSAADRSDDRELKIRLFSRVGEICRDRLQQAERAMKAFERVLAIDPQNEAAAGALVPLYRDNERWGRLLSVYEVLFEHAADTADQLNLVDKIRDLYETHLESKHLAFQWSRRAYGIAPDDSVVRADMERLAAESESWEELVEVYVDRLPAIEDSESRAAMLRHLAFLCGDKLHRPEDAEVFHRDLLELHPSDLTALEALEQIYSNTQRWEGLVDIYRRRAGLAAGDEEKRSFLFKVAFIQEERLGDPVGTIQTLQEALESDPQNVRALRWLGRLYEVRGEWFAMVDALQKLLEVVDGRDEQVDLHYRLGDILQVKLDAVEDGIESLAKALALDALHRGTIQALERHLVPDGPHRVRVARLLQPVYERAEDWEMLVKALEILLADEEDPGERLTLLRRLMGLHERRFEDLEAAFAAGSSILALDPGDRETRHQMARIAERLDRVDELAGLLTDALEQHGGEDPELEQTICWELATLLDEQLGRPAEAVRHLRRIIELRPTHVEAYELLERILRDAGDWEALRGLLASKREQTADPEAIRDILLQISALNENVLEDVPGAIRAYEEILTIEPGSTQAVKALERHYADEGRWRDLLELLGSEMEHTEDSAVVRKLKLQQADLFAHRLGEPGAAVDLLEETLAHDGAAPEAAVALLEELLEGEQELRGRITEILEPVYERASQWEDLVRVLLVRRSLVDGTFEKVELSRRAAELREERLEDKRGAFDLLREALSIDPAVLPVHDGVRRLAGELDLWGEAAGCWQEALQAADPSDLTLRGRLLMWLAEVHDERLDDPDGARRHYELLLELDPDNVETARPAARVLTRLYEEQGRWQELVDVLRRQLAWAEDGAQREETLLRVGRIQEEVLGETSTASQTYRELLDENPRSGEALDALERIYLQSERWTDLVDIYRRRVERASGAEERRVHQIRIAALFEEEIRDLDQAVAAYLSILDELPDDRECLGALARIYRDAERWPDLLEMLERLLALVDDEYQRVELLFEAASIEHRRLHSPAVAIDRYRAILEMRSDHDGAREALEELLQDLEHRPRVAELLMPIYRAAGDIEHLVKVHELLVEPAGPSERIRHLREVARLCEEALSDVDRAFEAYRRAVREAATEPELLELVGDLRRVTVAAGRWEDFAKSLESVALDVLDPGTRTALHLAVATVSRDELNDLDRAREHFHHVLDGDPTHREALEALDEIYQRVEEWEGLLEIVNRRVDLAEDDEARRGLLVRSAIICRDLLERPGEAIAAFERVLEINHKDAVATDALESLYTATERWVDLGELIEGRLARADDMSRVAALHLQLGKLRAEKLEDAARAVESYREVLALDPGNEEVVSFLESYLEDPVLQAEAARILQPYYVGRQDWPRLIRIYQIRLEAADDPEERLAITTRIAQLYEEQLEDLDGAFTWYSKVYLEKPNDVAIRDQILRLAGILDRWEEVARVMALHLENTFEENENTRRAAIILGGIYDERLYRVDQAVACYRRVLDNNRGDVEVFELLESLLTRAERWENLLELYRDGIDASDETEARRELMLKVCRVWEEALYNLPEAIDAYRAVLDVSDRDPEAIEALDRLYTETERWHDLCELLIREVEAAESPAVQLELRFRLGTVYELRLQDLPAAIDYYEEVLKQESENPRAIAALERLILDKDQRYRIAQILEPIYKRQDEWAKLVVIYDAQLDFIDDPERRGYLLREIARLHEERGGSLDLAFRALCRAFEEEFGDQALLEQIERLAAKLDNWPEVVEVLNHGAERTYDNDLLARIHARVALLMEERLGDQAGAVEAWRKVLAAREDHDGAIGALVRLLGVLERYEELVDVLQRKAELADEVQDRKRTYYQIADIQESLLHSTPRAVDAYRQVLALDEGDRTALDSLQRLYRDGESWMDLVGVYRQKMEFSTDAEERRTLQLDVARVYDEKVGDRFEAINAYRQLMEEDPRDMLVLDALDRLYIAEGLHSDLLEVLERKAEAQSDPEERNALLFRSARLLETEIGDLERGIDRYSDLLDRSPEHSGAREALERLVQDEGNRERVATVLERHYSATGAVEPLVRVLELRLALLADPHERRDLLQRIARLQEEGLGDADASFATQARAFAEVPEDAACQAELERMAEQLGCYDRLARVYEDRLADVYDGALSKRLHARVARLAEETLGDDGKAEEHYRAALDAEGDDAELLAALDGVLTRAEKWDELVEVLEREIQAVHEPERQAELYHRMGVVRMQRHEDLDGGFAAFRGALERDPQHAGARAGMEELLERETYRVPVLDVLEPIYEDCGEHAGLARLLETRLATLAGPLERTALLERIAQIQEEQLGSKDDALGALGRALAEDPGNERILDELERLADDLMRYPELAALAGEILAGEITADAGRALGLRTSRWFGAKLNDIERSEQTLRRVLELDPECGAALDGLEQIYRAGGESGQLAEVLARKAETELDGGRRRGLLVELAGLRSDELSDPDGAVEAWRTVLDQDPADREALAALAPLYERREAWSDLLDVLERQAQAASDVETQVAIRHRMGELLISRMEDPGRAVEIYRDILDRRPGDSAALLALEHIHSGREDWIALQEVLLWRLEQASGRDRIDVFQRLARLALDRLENTDEAIGYLHQILAEDERNEEALVELERILRSTSRWYDLVEILRRHAETRATAGDTAGEVEQLVAAARIWNDELENPEAAGEVLEEILQRDPENVTALAGLARIYESTEQWGKCREVLERAALLGPEPREAAELAFRMGRVVVAEGGDPGSGEEHYLKALESDPTHRDAIGALEEQYRGQRRWDRLAEVLARKVQLPDMDREGRLATLQELGMTYTDQLGDAAQGVVILEQARELDPNNTELLATLADAYYAADRLEEAEPLLQRLIELCGTRKRKEMARYVHRLGAIAEKRGDSQAAREHYDKAYRMDSTNTPTLVALGRIYMLEQDWDAARRIYRSMLLQNLDESSGITKADVFFQLGKVHVALDEASKARSMFERGLEADPEHQGLREALEAVKV